MMKKCDKYFLSLYIESFTIIFATRMVAITRADNREFIYISQPFLNILNQKNGTLAGKKLRDLPLIKPFIDEYLELLDKVRQSGCAVEALIAHDFNNSGINSIKLLQKKPIISPSSGKVIAVIDELKEFSINYGITQFIKLMNYTSGSATAKQISQPIVLTKREKEILFLLSLGKSPKNIAEFISKIENKILTPATVTATINKHLYLKFNVNSTSELIEQAVLLDLLDNIPGSFIRKSGVLMELD